MAYRNLDEFLARLEQAGEVKQETIAASAPPDAPAKSATHVLVSQDKASGTRIVQNLFGMQKRIEMALRVASLRLVADRLSGLLDLGKPGSLGALVKQAMVIFSVLRTTTDRQAPQAYESLPPADWRERLSGVLTAIHADNFSATLMANEPAPAIRPVRAIFTNSGFFVDSAPNLPVGAQAALVVGGDPAFIFAALTPLPDLIYRSYFASWLRERPLETMRLPSIDIDLPSNAEAVVTGTVRSAVLKHQNRFFDFDGYCLDFEVESVWTRANPVYLRWSRRDYHAVQDAMKIMFEPLARKLLPPGADMQQFVQYIQRTWSSDTPV